MSEFRAMVAREEPGDPKPKQVIAIERLTEADLPVGDVLVDVDYSCLNYKDGMALTGKNRIIRSYPMVPGVDYAGTVAESGSDRFSVGDRVILTGWGVGERFWGGYSQRQRTRSEWLVRCPDQMTTLQAMGIGTAGLTAMMCVIALEEGGLTPSSGPVLVTGAAGGVGSVAVALLSHLGFEVHAVTGRPEQEAYLKSLGASGVVTRAEMTEPPKPLETETWAGAVDTVGSVMLAKVLAQTKYDGVVAACGLAGGADLPTSVMPFILRNVRLQGVDSVMASLPVRDRAWARLATDLPAGMLDTMVEVVPLERLLDIGPEIIAGQIRGRVVVDPNL